MTPQHVEVTTTDGVVLRGQIRPGNDHAVLLLHDSRESSDLDVWNPLIPYLLSTEATIAAFDLRGHGVSYGEPDPSLDASDIAQLATWIRDREAAIVTAISLGDAAPDLLRASERTRIDGLVLISPETGEDRFPRGKGAPKLLLGGTHDPAMRANLKRVQADSYGPALTVNLPTAAQNEALLTGDLGVTCREHIMAFVRERHWEWSRQAALRASGKERSA
jgi:pimeloyl-ACP methyl ester carboxylesterase